MKIGSAGEGFFVEKSNVSDIMIYWKNLCLPSKNEFVYLNPFTLYRLREKTPILR